MSGRATSVMGHPLNAVAWLARELSAPPRKLGIGNIIATGSCTIIPQVLAGQSVAADFGPLGRVDCKFH